RSGGGFKLKVLEYVFNRVPVFALNGSFAGVPLSHGESAMVHPDHVSLARSVLAAIDDLDRLNRLQEQAFAPCTGRFDWAGRGRRRVAAITACPLASLFPCPNPGDSTGSISRSSRFSCSASISACRCKSARRCRSPAHRLDWPG